MQRLDQVSAEVAASNPSGDGFIDCFEFIHPAFRDDDNSPTTWALVSGGGEAVSAGIEPEDTVRGGQYLDYMYVPFQIAPPTISDSGVQDLAFSMPSVGNEIVRQLDLQASANREPIKGVYRIYRKSDLSVPAYFLAGTITLPLLTKYDFRCTLVFKDLQNKLLQPRFYSSKDFPGLR